MTPNRVTPISRFVYVTYIGSTSEQLWAALTTPEFMFRYWLGFRTEAEWMAGGAWKRYFPDGRLADTGDIIEFEPPKLLSFRWRHEGRPELAVEGWSVCSMDLEPTGHAVKLTLNHTMDREHSKLIEAVSLGWPQILSNLKSFVETGGTVLSPRTS